MSIVGIDEVGRGALAGPVVVAAVLVPKRLRIKNKLSGKLRDSKKLTPKAREAWFEYLKNESRIFYAISRVYPRGIEEKNIAKSANLAAWRAFSRLAAAEDIKIADYKVVLDGGLFLAKPLSPKPKTLKTVIKGDEKFNAIKLASIVAKVTRDRYMVKLSRLYPAYGFDIHKGYGTKRHLKAIRKHGVTKVHRLTFLKKYSKLKTRTQSSKPKTKS